MLLLLAMDMDSMAMSTATSTSAMAATMTGMAMPTSTSSMDMSSSSSIAMDMSTMAMTFFTSTSTPLFSATWTPRNSGEYAGTCIFLIVLAALFRALFAIRFNLFAFLARVKGRGFGEEDVVFGIKGRRERRPWRADEAVWIAGCDVLLAGVSYLLMIAVMTMNLGYFMSVLGGVFLGSIVFGRFMARSAAH